MSNKGIAWLFIGISLLILTVFLVSIKYDNYSVISSAPIKFDVTGQVGDFIGGVIGTLISAAGFYFLYLTFNDQKKSFEKERLENKFFDLIKLHRDNVSELRFDGTKLDDNQDSLFIEKILYEGKPVFNVIFNQFIICTNELKPFFNSSDKIYLPDYEKELIKNPFIVNNKLSITLLARIDICYNIVFFGVSAEGILILNETFKKKYKPKIINDILRFISLKPATDDQIYKKWKIVSNRSTKGKRGELVEAIYDWRKTRTLSDTYEFKETVENYHNRYTKYYGGHQFRLGHYYRHLYQAVKYINSQTNINYKEKYGYIKILRAQLSTYEQAVLFLNSLSSIGEAWELKPEIDTSLKNYQKGDFELITKYNLIKNLPGDSIYGIDFKTFYPNIEYESGHKQITRITYK